MTQQFLNYLDVLAIPRDLVRVTASELLAEGERLVNICPFSHPRRRRRNWFNHAKVRSMTRCHRPKPLPFSILRIVSRGKIWRARRARRMFSAS